MGVFSYVILGEPADAGALLVDPLPLDRFPGYGEKTLDPARWANLGTLLGLDPAITARMSNASPLAVGDPEEGPWVFEVPVELLDRVALLDGDAANAIARAWVEADRIVALGGVDYAHEALLRLVAAARRATSEKKHVLVRCDA